MINVSLGAHRSPGGEIADQTAHFDQRLHGGSRRTSVAGKDCVTRVFAPGLIGVTALHACLAAGNRRDRIRIFIKKMMCPKECPHEAGCRVAVRLQPRTFRIQGRELKIWKETARTAEIGEPQIDRNMVQGRAL